MPDQITETECNSPMNSYKYNDQWLSEIKISFKKSNKNVLSFMDNWSKSVDQSKEEKLNLAIVEQITRIVEKIRLECFHVTATLDSTFTKLNSLSEINPNQSQVYTVLQQQLIAVVDDKIPSLFSALSQINEAQFNETVKKAKSDFVAFENQEKSRLYLLVQLVAEKTAFMSPQISHASKNKSETIHIKKVDPPVEIRNFTQLRQKILR